MTRLFRASRTLVGTLLGLGLVFLYAPIVLVMLYSFNASDRVSVWGGWSVKWYHALLTDTQMLTAAWRSLVVAAATASLALVFGVCAAYALTRYQKFVGRRLLGAMTTLPLLMPEVVTGISMLLFFVSLQQIFVGLDRGLGTIIVAHSIFAIAYTTVVVRSRLVQLDQEIENAAKDLGATDAMTFLTMTLPLLRPALVAAWLLAFTLSFDDLVIASFVSGPSATTLPMRIYSSIRLGFTPQINALSTLIVLGVTVILSFVWWRAHALLKL